MKLKYIFITIGSMMLLLGLLTFATPGSSSRGYEYSNPDKSASIIISVLGLGTLLTGIFWKKQ